jgi:carbamoyltransferase
LSLTILGLSGALSHDPSAALYIDGKLIAAAEEERFIRKKHATHHMPVEAARFCLEYAGIQPSDIDVVALPYAEISIFTPARWHYAKRYWYAPDRVLDVLFNGNRRYRRYIRRVRELLEALNVDWRKVEFDSIEHHVAHASSAYHLSGFKEKTAILGIDGKGEYATTFFGYGENGVIHKIKEFYDPDSLGQLYASFTEYLGFEMLDGEYKVMGMAPYGDPGLYDLSRLIEFDGKEIKVDTKLVNTVGLRRYKEGGKGFFFSQALVDWLGPRRKGDIADDPYVHYAAAIQNMYESISLKLIDYYLGDILKETGKLVFAGGGALNVKLNQKILELPYVDELFVQPAANDSGTSVGAASYASWKRGVPPETLKHVYLGPDYTNENCIQACEAHPGKPDFELIENVPLKAAELIAEGHPIAWFQGRMEFGPRALGGRSILGRADQPGIADKINSQIKFRERWRPFCPSVLDSVAKEIMQSDHPADYMTITFDVADEWKQRMPEVVHEDGSARIQVVKAKTNPKYHQLLTEIQTITGTGVVLNTSLNRRGEPMVCSPRDALDMFFGSDLQYLMLEDLLVTKRQEA